MLRLSEVGLLPDRVSFYVSFKSFFVKRDLRLFYNSPCFTCVMSISHRDSGLHFFNLFIHLKAKSPRKFGFSCNNSESFLGDNFTSKFRNPLQN